MDHKDNQSPQGFNFITSFSLIPFSPLNWKKEKRKQKKETECEWKLMAGETARILVEFLEVAITSIVFLKGVYPSG